MNKKLGFTLIELLAVIVVLAIIMVIATTRVTRVIEKTRVNAFISTYDVIVRDVKNKLSLGDDIDSITCDDDTTNKCSSKYDISEKDYKLKIINNSNKIYVKLSGTENGKFSNIKLEYYSIKNAETDGKNDIFTVIDSSNNDAIPSRDELVRIGLYDTDKTISDKEKIDKALDVVKYKRLRDASDNTDYCEPGYKLYSSSFGSTIAKNAVNVVKNDVTGAKKYYYKNYIDEKTPNFCYYYRKSSSNVETYDIFFCMNDNGEYGNLKKINGEFVLKTPIFSEECEEEDEEGNCIDYSISGYNENKYSLDLQSYCYDTKYPQN